MSERQTKAGGQQCLNVCMFGTTFVFMCKLKSDAIYHMSHFTYHMSNDLTVAVFRHASSSHGEEGWYLLEGHFRKI